MVVVIADGCCGDWCGGGGCGDGEGFSCDLSEKHGHLLSKCKWTNNIPSFIFKS